jgi:pyridoxine 5-phosphate synthase
MQHLRLGINIDHIATVRNARGGLHPDPIRALEILEKLGADGITAHLREDRRHINDSDMQRIKESTCLPLNMEMAQTEEMLAIALKIRPHACCIVPEKRTEITTEGGLNVVGKDNTLKPFISKLKDAGIRVSLFIGADAKQIEVSSKIGADIVELHTGSYCHAKGDAQRAELQKITEGANFAHSLGLECHAGHGLSFETTPAIAAIANIAELNIGHFLIGEAIFVGLHEAVSKMRRIMDEARK